MTIESVFILRSARSKPPEYTLPHCDVALADLTRDRSRGAHLRELGDAPPVAGGRYLSPARLVGARGGRARERPAFDLDLDARLSGTARALSAADSLLGRSRAGGGVRDRLFRRGWRGAASGANRDLL